MSEQLANNALRPGLDARGVRVHLWLLFREGVAAFVEDNALSRGAAIAFYAVTALAPVLFIAVTIASIGFGRAAARGAVAFQLRHMMSPQSADLVQLAILHAPGTSHTLLGSILGLATLILTASGVFGEMEDALNVIWKSPRKHSFMHQLVRGRILSLSLVVSLGFLLLVSMIFTAAIGALGQIIDQHAPLSQAVIGFINFLVSFLLMTLLFAAIYKLLPNRRLFWRDVLVGAVGTALMFEMGQFLLGQYLGRIAVASAYGAAGGLIVLLVWVYYSAQIFLLGAEFTKVWATHHGSLKPHHD
ncbi:MAG TPA: YihY/virulence factor BrkB family protein [Rhizomicrobium sp.]